MTKLEAQYQDLKEALKRLKEASFLPPQPIIHQDGTIQRFEFTFELCWKIMQTIVRENKPDVYGPKNVIREAAKLGLISDPKAWFEFLKNRNLTVHTYKEEIAQQVYQSAKKFVKYVEELINTVEKYLNSD